VRPATSDDASAVASVAERAYRPYVDVLGFLPEPLLFDYKEIIDRSETWVVERGETVLAFAVFERGITDVHIANIAVDPRHQHEGLGRLLLDHARHIAAECDCSLSLYTNVRMARNLRIYLEYGFQLVDRRQIGQFDRYFLRLDPPV